MVYIETQDLNRNECIGIGGYSHVYKGKWKESKIIMKVFHQRSYHDMENIWNEIQIMNQLKHPNIIQYFGYSVDPLCICIEYIRNAINLREFINQTWNSLFMIHQKIEIGKQILSGLFYLHEFHPTGIIHGDLKLENILIDRNYHIKIIDFGLSEWIEKEGNQKIVCVGTYRYFAPEIYKNEKYNYKIDIYSYGILLYELFEESLYQLKGVLTKKEWRDRIYKDERPQWNNNLLFRTPLKIRRLVERCWQTNVSKRPTTQTVWDEYG